jgi:hypothetical protein
MGCEGSWARWGGTASKRLIGWALGWRWVRRLDGGLGTRCTLTPVLYDVISDGFEKATDGLYQSIRLTDWNTSCMSGWIDGQIAIMIK